MNKKNFGYKLSVIILLVCSSIPVMASIDTTTYISDQNVPEGFAISVNGQSAPLFANAGDYPGVIRVLGDLKKDIVSVTNSEPKLCIDTLPVSKNIVVVGTLGKSPVIDKLVKDGKLDVTGISGKWEAFMIQVVENPFPGTDKALVVVGSDKRGTIYGIYDISTKIGVSPWYWWADVPVRHKDALFVKPGKYLQGSPSVKYRGIFLNDEWPNLTNWVTEKFGTVNPSVNPPIPKGIANYNSLFYSKIFELILRLKGNYLWPAMWNNAFNEDDPENPRLANEYGIVMGTSHQEPMLRAQKEWDRRYHDSLGSWNYAKHPQVLENFWREGIRRNKNYESILTIGLRGANDTEMAPGGPEANKALLEKIVDRQRKIISEEINPDVTKVPQLWCLYKEVQEFYNSGMRVPDDVTLLWAEDNWGNVRRLPTTEERLRPGGAGVYYHFDYHGSPRNYQWLNTSPLAKIWDQMSLSKQYGADRVWIVNMGHFRGYELPLEYFMDLAWKTNQWTSNNINEYTRLWAKREFGETYAPEIANILSKYTKYNGRRKPELLTPNTYSLVNYQEAETYVAEYKVLALKAEEIGNKLPKSMSDAYFHLVLFPVKASALVNELYLAAGKNKLYAQQGRASANDFAAETRRLFSTDTSLMSYYNHVYADGRWNHFMDQTHLGYISWNDPPVNSLRAIKLVEKEVPTEASMGISVEGSEYAWPENTSQAVLPVFDVFSAKRHYIDIFNKGSKPFDFKVFASKPWILISEAKGSVEKDKRLWISINWGKAPKGKFEGLIKISGTGNNIAIMVEAVNPVQVTRQNLNDFVETEGYVSMEAEHFSAKTEAGENAWVRIEDYGHTLSGMRATAPANAPEAVPGKDSPCLEYRMYLFNSGNVKVKTTFGPVMNFMPNRPIRYAVSFDDEAPQIITLVSGNYVVQNSNNDWSKAVSDNARLAISKHNLNKSGYHTLKIWMIDPGVVLQKIVVDLGGVKPSYLGPPESFFRMAK
ncbi:MAG: glycosyl hydrolase 115 family protein [Bacteroidota bacterium]|nr:glycosyl hydrolase 115 family protein [Bacteroidota bacterium]